MTPGLIYFDHWRPILEGVPLWVLLVSAPNRTSSCSTTFYFSRPEGSCVYGWSSVACREPLLVWNLGTTHDSHDLTDMMIQELVHGSPEPILLVPALGSNSPTSGTNGWSPFISHLFSLQPLRPSLRPLVSSDLGKCSGLPPEGGRREPLPATEDRDFSRSREISVRLAVPPPPSYSGLVPVCHFGRIACLSCPCCACSQILAEHLPLCF